jgi:signal transduction histidine kinase
LAILSHDLRNLIASMTLNLELLARGWAGEERRAAGRRQLEASRRVLTHMAELVAVLLDGNAGRPLELIACDAAGPAREVVEMLDVDARKNGQTITMSLASDQIIRCDRARVLQVLTNLVGNALKFSPPGAAIHVELRARPGGICYSVIDAGPGVRAEDRTRIFERNFRSGDRDKPGLGLGLWIAREIVVAHGGRIWVESEPGAGSRFHVYLPTSRF